MAPILVVVDEPAVHAYLDGPFAAFLSGTIGPIVSRGARRRALVRSGKLLDSIDWSEGHDIGGSFTEVHAIFYDLFQERPARQVRTATRALVDAMNRDTPRLL